MIYRMSKSWNKGNVCVENLKVGQIYRKTLKPYNFPRETLKLWNLEKKKYVDTLRKSLFKTRYFQKQRLLWCRLSVCKLYKNLRFHLGFESDYLIHFS